MILLQLFFEFFCVGLLAVGGGLATVPFLTDMATRTGWFTLDDLTNMIAVSESTPGPLGVNMASYVGFATAGIPGGVVATLGLITPCIIIILIVTAFLKKFRQNATIQSIFYGLRPASTGLIAAACWAVICLSLIEFSTSRGLQIQFHWPAILLAFVILLVTHLKWTKKFHPVIWIGVSAVAGILFEM